MAKKVKNADMFDVYRFKCWMFPCLESDIKNQEFNADQQRKIRETMRQKRKTILKTVNNSSASVMGALVYLFVNQHTSCPQ
jgi:hypothetical protein